jgi:hypothetical protein
MSARPKTFEGKLRTENRRSHPRRAAKGEVDCRMDKLGMGRPIRGHLVDLSISGACFRLDREVHRGDEIEVELIPVGNVKSVRTSATVKQVRPGDEGEWLIGCEFDKRISYQQLTGFC